VKPEQQSITGICHAGQGLNGGGAQRREEGKTFSFSLIFADHNLNNVLAIWTQCCS
jgi:hypothetical protein